MFKNGKSKRHSLAKRLKKINQLEKVVKVQKKKIQTQILQEFEDEHLKQEKYDDGVKVVICSRSTTALNTSLLAKRLNLSEDEVVILLQECRTETGQSIYPLVS